MKVLIYDIETYTECFLVGISLPGKVYREFEISKYKNELDSLILFMDNYIDYYWVGYNNLRFDSQVMEWVYRNWERWEELPSLEICARIAQKAQDVIHDANFDVFADYREEELTFKQIDLFKIHHFDNKMRRVSLKRLEFEMDFPNIEEMPIHHLKTDLTKDEIKQVKHYCKNDVMATEKFYFITIGETNHPLYKEDNKIEMRLAIEQEFGLPCLNYSNSKIGDELIKKFYCETKKIQYKDLPKKGFFRKEIRLKNCIPSYIEFKTPELKKFLLETKTVVLKMTDDFVRNVKFRGQTYSFAKGGLHNVINGKIYEANENENIYDVDVGGYYPAIIINNDYFPFHLGKEFLVGYSKIYFKRIDLKPLAKKDKKIKGIVGGLKEAGNCPYGKSGAMDSWLFDKQMTISTCLTGELSLLMLIEAMELQAIKCIMANTDGATFIVPKGKEGIYESIKEWWILKTTKKLSYVLEEVRFQKMIFSSCNHYIGIKTDGEVKYKGSFLIDFELHKNKSARIVNIALDKYFTQKIPIQQTIIDHSNLYDFCIRQKASRDFHYEGIHSETDKVTIYDKLIRYYISNKGEKILKIKNPQCQTNAPAISQVDAGIWLATVCNKIDDPVVNQTTNIDYKYYIEKAEAIVYKILSSGKKRKVKVQPQQISLF